MGFPFSSLSFSLLPNSFLQKCSKLPAPKFLSQALLSGEVKWRQMTWEYGFHPSLISAVSVFVPGNGSPLQYSCLENSMDGGAWWGCKGVSNDWGVYGVAKSQQWLSGRAHTHTFIKKVTKESLHRLISQVTLRAERKKETTASLPGESYYWWLRFGMALEVISSKLLKYWISSERH